MQDNCSYIHNIHYSKDIAIDILPGGTFWRRHGEGLPFYTDIKKQYTGKKSRKKWSFSGTVR